MTNRPKAIGTAAETAVVRYLAAHGFPAAERRALHGATDLGDITGTPGLCRYGTPGGCSLLIAWHGNSPQEGLPKGQLYAIAATTRSASTRTTYSLVRSATT